jgi:surfactin synthase thioesterase subunit/predicted MFS family arabinose efflux permease
VAARWAQVLGVESVGIDDNFFDLGGDSFKAVRAVSGLDLTAGVLDLFRHPTVRSFVEHTTGETEDTAGLLHELTPPRAAGERTLTLVCLPFAGGGAITYQALAAAMPDTVSLYALQAPGHDLNRPDEPPLAFNEIVRGCVAEIRERITGPIALYGHCMGGALTVALARALEAAGIELVRVIIGGHFPAPRLPGRLSGALRRLFPMRRWTSKRQALDFLRAMGFFTDVLDEAQKDFVMRVFLADTQDGEDYYTRTYADPAAPKLAAPIVCVVGESDRATELYQERFTEWEHFSDSVSLEVIPRAGHYFQKHQAAELAGIITARCAEPAAAPPPQHPAPAARPNLKVFSLVAFGQFVSLVGTGLTTFAMGLWVYQQTRSISLFAITAVTALLPAVVLAPIAGALADRWDRRKIMIMADCWAACGTATLAALLWTDHLALWHIYLVVAVGAIANAFQQPAYLAAISQLVPKRYYGKANGIAQLGGSAGLVLAPLLGGALVVAIGLPGIVLIDLATFAIAVTVTCAVRFPDTLFKRREEPFGREIVGGWRYIVRRRGLLAIILFTAVLNYLFGMVEVLVTPLTLALGQPTALGLVLAASGAGLLTGSVAMSVWGGLVRRTNGILAGFLLIGASMLIIGLHPHPLFPAAGLFGMGLATAVLNAHWLSIVQAKVGLELQGRVIATTLMLSWMMVPAGFLSAGPLADHVFEPLLAPGGALAGPVGTLIGTGTGRGIGLLVIVAGLGTILLGLAGLRYRPVRFLEDDLPDAIPDAELIADKDQLQELADRRIVTNGSRR